ncbi:MAG: 1,4-alpha-glucan branching protein domain-containing protein [Solirubrobacteraceae bacterium]
MSPVARSRAGGALSIVLHTHMPYVEGFGTWPFGEEWLWEAIASSYLPLLELLDGGAPLTLSLTPVLCDQLEADVQARFERFVFDVRRATHVEDAAGLRRVGEEALAAELERCEREYGRAARHLARRHGDLLDAFAEHAAWTSSATHALLPLVASDAGLAAQIETGVRSHLRRFGGRWRGGFWLPECAYAPGLEGPLLASGVRASCVELTSLFGLGAWEHLRPLVTAAGLTLVPIDRATMTLVWSEDGYPAHRLYRDYHRHTVHHHNPWRNGGDGYDHDAALALAREHAADFVERTKERLAAAAEAAALSGVRLPEGGLVVCALDTELLGHWWYEGVDWLTAVVEECERAGLPLLHLDDALERSEPVEVGAGELPASSWGAGGGFSTWSGPAVAEMAFCQRESELRLLRRGGEASVAALRELLAMQASDWAFMVSRELARPYAQERFAEHRDAFERALSAGAAARQDGLRNLARHAQLGAFGRR